MSRSRPIENAAPPQARSDVTLARQRGLGFWHRPFAAPAVLCAAYTVVALAIFARLGSLAHLEEIVFSAPDAQGYRTIADFFGGGSERPDAELLGLRPLLFPLLLTTYRVIGVVGFVLLQWLLNLCTVLFTFSTLTRITGLRRIGIAGAGLLILHPTFSFIALHALCEPLALALIAGAVSRFVDFFVTGERRSLGTGCFLLCAASCAKPVYLPICYAACAYAAWDLFRKRPRAGRAFALAALAASPLLVQLFLSFLLTGQPTISTAGRFNFENRFFPVVVGVQRGTGLPYDQAEERAASAGHPALGDKVRYVVGHPAATVAAVGYLLRSNVLTGSSFVRQPPELFPASRLGEGLEHWSGLLNAAIARIHVLAAVVLMGVALRRIRGIPAWAGLLACASYILLLTSALTYAQGDRLILAAVPIWIVAYASISWPLLRRSTKLAHTQRSEATGAGA